MENKSKNVTTVNVIGTGSKAQCPARFKPAKALRNGIEPVLEIVKSGLGYCFKYNSEFCALIAKENSPEYKCSEGTVTSYEQLNEMLEDVNPSKITSKILNINPNSTYTIEINIHKTKQKINLNPFDINPLLKGKTKATKDAILSRVEYIKNNSNLTDLEIYKFVRTLIEKKKNIKTFDPKYSGKKTILAKGIYNAVCKKELNFKGNQLENIDLFIQDLLDLCNVEKENISLAIKF